MHHAPRRALVAVSCAALLVLAASPAGANTYMVGIRDNYFTTPFRVITVGDEVTWTNSGSDDHTVVAFNGSFDSSPETVDGSCDATLLGEEPDCIEPGGSITFTFDDPGVYNYYCKVTGHANTSLRPDGSLGAREQPCGMCGQIKVKRPVVIPRPSATESTVTPITPTPSKTPKKSPTASPSVDPSATASGTAISTIPAAEGDGTGGRLGIAFLLIVGLGGVGYYTWRRYIAP